MILITGGNGYIGSHFIIELSKIGSDLIVVDNFTNSEKDNLKNISEIIEKEIVFIQGDIKDNSVLKNIIKKYNIKTIIHLAGYKSISESIINPIKYYNENINSFLSLIEAMSYAKVQELIFSSSATVYGNKFKPPWNENLILEFPQNAYAQTKYIIEKMLKNLSNSNSDLKIGILRYFNPVGYHESGLIGENLNIDQANLVPSILQVLLNIKSELKVFGNFYDTLDGSGVRDYIHIEDLIRGHLEALKYIQNNQGLHIWNLGIGKGYSVFEVIKEFENQLNIKLPYIICDKREGDLSEYWADVSKANNELGWIADKNLKDIVKSTFGRLNYLRNNKKN